MADRNAIPRTPDPDIEPGWKLRFEDRWGLLDPIRVFVFRSFGTPDALHIRGRVAEQKGVKGIGEDTSTWQNILNTLHRLESTEIPGARLRAHFAGREWETRSDGEGYYVFDLDVPKPLEPGWHDVRIELVESVGEPDRRFTRARVLVPSPNAEFAVVSDLDDTVIKTRSTEFLRQMEIIFGKGAHDRVVFPGIPALYRALERGPDNRGHNPVFYVSMSGWNLYDLFAEFMDVNDLPAGPLFLSDFRVLESKSKVLGSDQHKFESVDLLLRTYPELPFILVGDSGMHDPELYQKIVKAHPGRVRAIYIHDVSPPKRDREIQDIAKQLNEAGVPLVRAENTLPVAEHAAEQGFISEDGLQEVRNEVQRQKTEHQE